MFSALESMLIECVKKGILELMPEILVLLVKKLNEEAVAHINKPPVETKQDI